MHAPEKYEENKSAALRDIDQSVPELMKFMTWKPHELILDYGCGAGSTGRKYFVPKAEEYDSKIHSVDVSAEMIEHAKTKFPHPRVSYTRGNILDDDFPLRDEQFDRIFAIYVFHYIKDYREAMRRFFTMMKPGGEFAFTVLARSTLFKLYSYIGEDPRFKPYMEGYEKFVPEWFEEKECAEHAKERFTTLIQEVGFKIKHVEVHHQQFHHQKFETLIQLYLALNPFVNVIPLELHDELRAAYRKGITGFYNLPEDVESIETKHEMLTAVVEKPY